MTEDWDEVFMKAEAMCTEAGEDTYSYLVNRRGGIIYMFCGNHFYFPDNRNYYSEDELLYVRRVKGSLLKSFVSGYIERYVRSPGVFSEYLTIRNSKYLASEAKAIRDAMRQGKMEIILGRLLQRINQGRERVYTMEEARAILGLKEEE